MRNLRWLCLLALMLSSLLLAVSAHSMETVKNLNLGIGSQIIAFGDSYTSGYGVPPSAAYPSVLSRTLGVPIVNRGVSGDTTARALMRLQGDVIAAEPWLVIVGLGINDFVQEVPQMQIERNLREIVTSVQGSGAIVVLLGMTYGGFDRYEELYQRVAVDTKAYLIPHVFKGILDTPRYQQDDVVHPNEAGHELLATRVAVGLKPLLEQASMPLGAVGISPAVR